MIDRVGGALRANLIWLVVCTILVGSSTFYSTGTIDAITANFTFFIGSIFGAFTLAKSAYLGKPEYNTVKYFIYLVAISLVVLGVESFCRGYVALTDNVIFFVTHLSAPFNVAKLSLLAGLLIVNASIQKRGFEHTVLARTVAIGVGLGALIYMVLFFVVRDILS